MESKEGQVELEQASNLETQVTRIASSEIASDTRRPALLGVGGANHFSKYQAEFDRLYHSGEVIDVRGMTIIFTKDRCEHVCFKSEDEMYNQGPRTKWSQERADRIPWILEALKNPSQIRPDHDQVVVYMLVVKRDDVNKLPGERYAALVDASYFLTAFPVTSQARWQRWIDGGPRIWPEGDPPKKKTKKKTKRDRTE